MSTAALFGHQPLVSLFSTAKTNSFLRERNLWSVAFANNKRVGVLGAKIVAIGIFPMDYYQKSQDISLCC